LIGEGKRRLGEYSASVGGGIERWIRGECGEEEDNGEGKKEEVRSGEWRRDEEAGESGGGMKEEGETGGGLKEEVRSREWRRDEGRKKKKKG
jgi:hypothetical protein